MNPFRSRLWRTVILFFAGIAVSYLLASLLAPYWPEFCGGPIVDALCEVVATRTMAGYPIIALGVLTLILGPITGSLLDVFTNGSKWEMRRGKDTVITTMPLLAGAIYLGTGMLTVATV